MINSSFRRFLNPSRRALSSFFLLTSCLFFSTRVLYLAHLTNRIAILTSFWANQQIISATRIPELPVSRIFNLTRLELEVPLLRGVLEWSEIHPIVGEAEWEDDSESWEEIGGWGGIQLGVKYTFAKLSDSPSLFRERTPLNGEEKIKMV